MFDPAVPTGSPPPASHSASNGRSVPSVESLPGPGVEPDLVGKPVVATCCRRPARWPDSFGVASVTAQRARRELQQRGLTYAVVGKGTFVHPLATERLAADPDVPRGADTGTWLFTADPDLDRRVAQFLLLQNQITGRFVEARMAKDTLGMNAAADELAARKAANNDLAPADCVALAKADE